MLEVYSDAPCRYSGTCDVHTASCGGKEPWTESVSQITQFEVCLRLRNALHRLANLMLQGEVKYLQTRGRFFGWGELYDNMLVGCNIGRAGAILMGEQRALDLHGSNFWYELCELIGLPDDVHVHMAQGGTPSLREMLEAMNDAEGKSATETAAWLRSLQIVYAYTDEQGHLPYLLEKGMPRPVEYVSRR